MKEKQTRKQKRTLWAGYAYQNARIPSRGPAYKNERPRKRMHLDFAKISLMLSAILIGVFVGNVIFKLIPRPAPITFGEKWEYSEAAYEQAHTVQKTAPDDVTDAYELWQVAYSNMLKADYVTVNTEGYTKASIATQQIRNYRRYSRSEGFVTFDIVSTGMVTVKESGYYDVKRNRMMVDIAGIGESAIAEIGYFLPTYGVSPRGFLNFEVSDQTLLSKSDVTYEDGVYTFSLELDPIASAEKYTRQVYHMAGGQGMMPDSKKPIHKKVELVVTVDADFMLLSVSAKEKYKIFTPVKADCTGECTDYFTYEAFEFSAEDKAKLAA